MDRDIHFTLVEAENTPKTWKIFHILFVITASFCGLCAGVLLSIVYAHDYILCSSPKVAKVEGGGNVPYVQLNNETLSLRIVTENKSNCDFALYSMIVSSIFGVNWAVFFIMCGAGGKSNNGLPQPWRIVLPALLFSAVLFFVDLAAGSVLTIAINTFCQRFEEQLLVFLGDTNELQDNETYKLCNSLDLFLSTGNFRIQTIMVGAEVTTWLCAVAWGCSAFLCCLRVALAPDFSVQLIPAEVLPGTSNTGQLKQIIEASQSKSATTDDDTPGVTLAQVIQRVYN